MPKPDADWTQDYMPSDDGSFEISNYELTSTPNDFNVLTIYNFLESGTVKVPNFQRNFIWDIRRASKLIESLIIGLPVPQIFLYEKRKNLLDVIDGQQRLMSIYYFIQGRFPRKTKRAALRRLFDTAGQISPELLADDNYFSDFRLEFGDIPDGTTHALEGLSYATLGERRTTFQLRTVRNVVIKQLAPPDDVSAAFEIFARLNSGGVNISAQEIRASLYQSRFLTMLHRLNALPGWRRVIQQPDPDARLKDIELLLRGFAMLLAGDSYAPSMTRFLNTFASNAASHSKGRDVFLEKLFGSFLRAVRGLPASAFIGQSGRFNVALFEAVFAAICAEPLRAGSLVRGKIDASALKRLEADKAFVNASQEGTTKKTNVATRLRRARKILTS